jgi:ornithine cyclodeaminase/alanine dehydrogenase-like protein (mu-crystallin family)
MNVPVEVAGARILTRTEIEAAIGFDTEALEAIHRAFVWIDEGRVQMPPIMHIDVPEHAGAIDIKSAYVRGVSTLAVKVGAGYAGNRAKGLPTSPAMVLVFDASTGIACAVLFDEAYLTDLRTGLAGAVAARLLAPQGKVRVGILGAGVQARFQLRALKLVRDIAAISVWSRSAENAQQFAEEVSTQFSVPTEVRSIDALAATSDVIITTTPSTTALLTPELIQPGTHITAVGSDLPGKRELATELLSRADCVVCDDITQSRRLGELQGIDDQSLRRPPVLLSALANGRVQYLRAASDITIADLSGLGVQDTAITQELLSRLARK